MALPCLQDMAKRNDLLVERAARRRFGVFRLLARPWPGFRVAVNSVVLDHTGRDRREGHLAEELHEMDLNDRFETLDVGGAPLAQRDDFILLFKPGGGFTEGLAAVRRQLLFLVSDNYISLPTTTTVLAKQRGLPKLVLTGAEGKALQGCNLSADSGARPGSGWA